MPTDNPKISLYVPQQIYDRFKSFQEERKLSMSQAGIVVLAEYFGMEETIKEFTEGTTIGGVTLAEFKQLKQRIEQLEKQVGQSKSTSKPLQQIDSSPVIPFEKITKKDIEPIIQDLLARRLNITSKSIGNQKSNIYKDNPPDAEEKFGDWTKNKDPDGIPWKAVKQGRRVKYIPSNLSELSSELLSKLQTWIAQNT